jgi:hypothetical protein
VLNSAKTDQKSQAPVNGASSLDRAARLLSAAHINLLCGGQKFLRVELVLMKGKYYSLLLHTRREVFEVARKEGDVARRWINLHSALRFIQDQFGLFETIYLIHPQPRSNAK